MTVGYLLGSFDLLNVGDLDLIGQARERCDRLVLGVYSDEKAHREGGRRPVVPLEERLALLRYVRGVDDVVVHDPEELLPVDLMFASEAEPARGEGVELLVPRRQSASAVLRRALAPAGGTAGAGAVA